MKSRDLATRGRVRRGREAFTLIEVLVFSGLGVLVLFFVMRFFVGGQKQAVRISQQQVFERSANEVLALIRRDVRHAMTSPVVTVDPPGLVLEIDRGAGAETLAYAFDPETGQLSRRERVLRSLAFARVDFTTRSSPGVEILEVSLASPTGERTEARMPIPRPLVTGPWVIGE